MATINLPHSPAAVDVLIQCPYIIASAARCKHLSPEPQRAPKWVNGMWACTLIRAGLNSDFTVQQRQCDTTLWSGETPRTYLIPSGERNSHMIKASGKHIASDGKLTSRQGAHVSLGSLYRPELTRNYIRGCISAAHVAI